jgi:hypothetical protein
MEEERIVQSYIMDINCTDKKEKVVLCTFYIYLLEKKTEKTNFKLQSAERYNIRSSKIVRRRGTNIGYWVLLGYTNVMT